MGSLYRSRHQLESASKTCDQTVGFLGKREAKNAWFPEVLQGGFRGRRGGARRREGENHGEKPVAKWECSYFC